MTEQAETLLTEHFRYTPLSLIDDIINTVNTIVYRAIEAIENGLFSVPPQQLGYSPDSDTSGDAIIPDADHPDSKDEIENGVHQLETLLEATVDKTFDKFEIYTLRNILTVPDELAPWVRLGHYEGLTLPLSADTPTPESILALRRKVQETRKLNLALRNTHASNAATITQLKSLLSTSQPKPETQPSASPSLASTSERSLAFLVSHPAATSLGLSFRQPSKDPLTTNTQFFISQLPALRQALAELKPRLKSLPEKIGDVDWESRREERRAYIEGRVRKVVDGLGGGGGGDGDGMKGVRVGREEVRDLEGVVGAVGRGERMEE
ncbi:MAG: hypothetical protein LQ338_007442 [Usnochroma carphineum]|nr:MAG: hypothetical protein LQ338_007442 [Usnochroma carphineum]